MPFAADPPVAPPFIGLAHQTEAVLVHLVGHDDVQEKHK